jgi:CRISPR-associated protein Csd1
LLAVAEYIERSALNQAGEKRPTNAERHMQRFADHPCSTWRDLEKQIAPYLQRLQTRESSYWIYDRAKRLLQEICDSVTDIDNFTSPRKLDGEFLLGYHCQYSDLFKKNQKNFPSTDQKGEQS